MIFFIIKTYIIINENNVIVNLIKEFVNILC